MEKKTALPYSIANLDHAGSVQAMSVFMAALEALTSTTDRVEIDASATDGLDLAGIQLLVAFNRSIERLDQAPPANPDWLPARERLVWNWGSLAGRITKICSFAGIDPDLCCPGLKKKGA